MNAVFLKEGVGIVVLQLEWALPSGGQLRVLVTISAEIIFQECKFVCLLPC
jgi:hypothetical protein